jgi:type I restriction enzyme S subunit
MFLQYFLDSRAFKNQISKLTTGAAQQNFGPFHVKQIKLLKPKNIKEQQKIASVLSTVDELIQKTDQIIEQTQRLKKGLMQRLLTKGIGDTKFKKTELGEIPEGWEVINLGQVIENLHYGTSVMCTTIPTGVPILRIPNIVQGVVNLNDLKYASLSKEDLQRFALQEGDILFVRTNGNPEYVGRCAVFHKLNGIYGFASYLIKAELNIEKLNPDFLILQLSLPSMRTQIRNHAKTSAGQYNINTEGLKSIKVVMPPLRIQNKIISIISSLVDIAEIYNNEKHNAEDVKRGLMQNLLTGKLRVKV